MNVGIVFEGDCANYLEDAIAGGMRDLLGPACVRWWPHKKHLASEAPDAIAPEGTCWIGPPDCAAGSPDAVGAFADLLLVGSPTAPGRVDAARAAIRAARGAVVRGMDGNDEPKLDALGEVVGPPWFVRECRGDSRTIPTPLAVFERSAAQPLPWGAREIDVLWGGSIHQGRAAYVDALEGLRARGLVVEIVRGRDRPLAEWNRLLGRSKACVVLAGAGKLTYRHFEAGAAGCIPVVERHGLSFERDYRSEALRFSSPREMLDAILTHFPDAHGWAAGVAAARVWGAHTARVRATEILLHAAKAAP